MTRAGVTCWLRTDLQKPSKDYNPSIEAEDQRHLHRDLETLKQERARTTTQLFPREQRRCSPECPGARRSAALYGLDRHRRRELYRLCGASLLIHCYPPAMAPTMSKGSAPVATASGSGASGDAWDRSCSQAKNLTNARRRCVPWSRIVPRNIG